MSSYSFRKFIGDEEINYLRLKYNSTRELWTDHRQQYMLSDYDKEWRRPRDMCDHPKFVDGKPSRFDACQGEQGNCWLASAIEAITLNDELIHHVVPPGQSFDYNYIGAFHFRIWHFGHWYDVVVDDKLPVLKSDLRKPAYIHSNRGDIFWAALLEKAYAKVYGDFITNTFVIDDLKTGYSMDALQDLSGGIIELVQTSTPPDGLPLSWFMHDVFSKKSLMCCRRYTNIGQTPDLGIFDRHSYSITNIFRSDDPEYHGLVLVRVMNPWGDTEWQGEWRDDHYRLWKQIDQRIRQNLELVARDDGEFWMSEEDFVKYFERVFVCHLGPGQYIESRRHKGLLWPWSKITLYGEWVKKVSSGGQHPHLRHINPQYRFHIETPVATYRESVGVVIELIQKPKSGRGLDREHIAFYIYSLNHLHNPPMPLDENFFKTNKPFVDYPDFSMGFGRAFAMSLKLETGSYCIVPVTEIKNVSAPFLLRIYSQIPTTISIVEHDTKISKQVLTEEQSLNEYDERLKRRFTDVARGQDEIDWIGLKEILRTSMNQSKPYFGSIATFLKFIWDIIKKQCSFRSSNDCETEGVVFTEDECRSMVAMLDNNHSGKLCFSEFSNLWNKICFWTEVYNQHRDETEGWLRVTQLRDALSAIGYNLNKRTIHSLVYVYANELEHIFLTDFILCGVNLETALSHCQKEDFGDEDAIAFTLEEWVKHTLNL